MRVLLAIVGLSLPIMLDIAIAWRYGLNRLPASEASIETAGIALSLLNVAAAWLVLGGFAYLIATVLTSVRSATFRIPLNILFFFAFAIFVFYLGFTWGFVYSNGFSPSWDAIWFLTLNVSRLPQHTLQSSFVLSISLVAVVLVLSLLLTRVFLRLAASTREQKGWRKALALVVLGAIVAATTAPKSDYNVSAVAFTRIAMQKVAQAGKRYTTSLDPATVFEKKTAYVPAPAASLRKFPVIVLLIDSLRRDLLTMSPTPMPKLKQRLSEFIWFDKAYATASHSNYADVAFWYAQYPLRSVDFYWQGYPLNAPFRGISLFSAFRQHGFATGYVSSQNEEWGQMINWLDVDGEVDFFFHAEDFGTYTWFDRENARNARNAVAPGIDTAGKLEDSATLGVALDWISSLGGRTDFLLGLNLQNTHFSYVIPAGGETPYQPYDLDIDTVYYSWPEKNKTKVLNRYLNAAFNLDIILDRFIEELRRRGLWKQSLFIIVGDSGEAFHEHGFGNHSGPMYDEVMRTLTLVKLPGDTDIAPGRYEQAVSHIDIAAMIPPLLGMPTPDTFQGQTPFAAPAQRDVYMHSNAAVKQHGLVQWPWKLLQTYYPFERLELYDLEADPMERRNLAAEDTEQFERLRRKLDNWVEQQVLYYSAPEIYRDYAPPRPDRSAGTATR